MITVCLDDAHDHQVQSLQLPAVRLRPRAVAFAPYLVNKMGRNGTSPYADYSWGQCARDAYVQEIQRSAAGRRDYRHSARHPDMTSFLSDHRQRYSSSSQGRRDHRQPGLRPRHDQEVQVGG
jgi:hypothetical protein